MNVERYPSDDHHRSSVFADAAFSAQAPHLTQHPEFVWQKGLLGDMNAYPWKVFKAQSRN